MIAWITFSRLCVQWQGGQSVSVSTLLISLFFATNAILAQLDAWSLFQNYKQLKDRLFIRGFHKKLLRTMLNSMCQREAALVAASELRMGDQCREYFARAGYRWYHLMPDFVFSYPGFLFSRYFWKSTFFAPYYRQKIDFFSEKVQAERKSQYGKGSITV
jgi:hypothetical protein